MSSISETKQKIEEIYPQYDQRYGMWGWCTLNMAGCLVDVINNVCEKIDNPVCVEIGVYGGKSILPVALELKRHGRGIIHAIDPWTNSDATSGYDSANYDFWNTIDLNKIFGIFKGMLSEFDLNSFVNIIQSTSNDAPEIDNIDFLFIDGQHTEQCILDIKKYASKVKPGGCCILDDTAWGEVVMAPDMLKEMGFEQFHSVDTSVFFIRKNEIKEFNEFYSLSKKPVGSLWVKDNFYQYPDKVREFALRQEYIEGGLGRGFIGRRSAKQFLFPGLKNRFETIMGKKITSWQSMGMNGRFQTNYAGEPLVYHCDDNTYGGILYLTPNAPYQCGTTLFGDKKNRARTYYDPGWSEAWDLGASRLDRTPFEPVDVVGNVYNRLMIFDASCIHSASEYFGLDMNNSRLIQIFFFNAESDR